MSRLGLYGVALDVSEEGRGGEASRRGLLRARGEAVTAGRHFDAWIAQWVMGRPLYEVYDGEDILGSVPAYSTDMAAAVEVVEKLRLAVEYDGKTWTAGMKMEGAGGIYWAIVCEAETAPLAICLAAQSLVNQ